MKRASVLLVSVFFISACNGGGGSDDDFSGVWNGSASLVEDTCGIVEFSIFFNHLVEQDRNRLELDNGATRFEGSADEDSFRVTAERAYEGALDGVGNCTEEIIWRYEAIERDAANFVVRQSVVTCLDDERNASCMTTFTGSAFRSTRGGGGPIFIDPLPAGGAEGAVSDTDL